MSFSERYGYVTKELQQKSIDNRTRNLLWNVMHDSIFAFARLYASKTHRTNAENRRVLEFYLKIWNDYFNYKTTEFNFSQYVNFVPDRIEKYLDKCTWNNYYDFIEFLLESFLTFKKVKDYKIYEEYFVENINTVLEKQKCLYRLVNKLILPLTNDGEIGAIVTALESTSNIQTVHTHLRQAIHLFSDRENPDYRNSIKESISSIESLMKIVVGNENATLSDEIKELRKHQRVYIHPSLLNSINSLYGWAGDESGIRHSQKNESKVDVEDAQFILVTCCSLASYITAKAIKSGIEFSDL